MESVRERDVRRGMAETVARFGNVWQKSALELPLVRELPRHGPTYGMLVIKESARLPIDGL